MLPFINGSKFQMVIALRASDRNLANATRHLVGDNVSFDGTAAGSLSSARDEVSTYVAGAQHSQTESWVNATHPLFETVEATLNTSSKTEKAWHWTHAAESTTSKTAQQAVTDARKANIDLRRQIRGIAVAEGALLSSLPISIASATLWIDRN